jgi:D-alanine-D-alanine ligase
MRTAFDGQIVLVVSKPPRPHGGYKRFVSKLAFSKSIANRMLLRALRQLDRRAFYYDNLSEFLKNIDLHQKHLVFPYYYSLGSRINYSRVQSICESVGIQFVGPEAYALTVCTDKVLSKDICRSQGLMVPRCAVFYAQSDRPALDVLETPLIVKPVFEGDSRGVTGDSICVTREAAEAKALALYAQIDAPVMVEEFIEGVEVNVCLLQDGKGEYRINAVALNKRGSVYDYRQKHFRLPCSTYQPYQGTEVENNLGSFLNIAKMLGKVEFLRIDCIIREGQLLCLELTPDADLAITSALYRSVAHEMDYISFVRLMVENAIESYRSLSTS